MQRITARSGAGRRRQGLRPAINPFAPIPQMGGGLFNMVNRRIPQLGGGLFNMVNRPGFGRRFNAGGSAGGDTVPAMLTPGEFIMSNSAVQKHGVGFMKHLNRGHIPGFRRGGLIGTGNVQYKQNGGGIIDQIKGMFQGAGLEINPDKIASAFSTFNTDLVGNLDTFINKFSGFGESINQLVSGIQAMNWTHTHTIKGMIELNGLDTKVVSKEITDAFQAEITKQINAALDAQKKKVTPP